MKNRIVTFILLLSFTSGNFIGCVKEDSFHTPENTLTTYELVPTTTVEVIIDAATTTPIAFTTDEVIEAYVTSSDEKGNFYKSISFQTIPKDKSNPIGFSVPINVTTLYGKGFTPGRKVYIKLNGLYSAIVYGALQIGTLNEGTIGRISEFEWKKHLFPSTVIVFEDFFVRKLSLEKAYSDDNQNTLVELEDVQFSDTSINRTYYDIDSGGGATNHTLVSPAGGLPQIIRFSKFCPFTGNQAPSLSGKIRGVLTKYDTDFQFIVRYENDIRLTFPRFDQYPPLGGTALVYFGKLNEAFTSYTTNAFIFSEYINDAVVGSRYWQIKNAGSNKYIQMSAFGGTPEANKTVFIVPVDFTKAGSFSFKTKSGYDNGSPLKVYYSLDYVPGGNMSDATLVDITDSFTLPNGPVSGYASAFTASGNYLIPDNLIGNGYFIFEYNGNGNGGITTTLQIDSIVIK